MENRGLEGGEYPITESIEYLIEESSHEDVSFADGF